MSSNPIVCSHQIKTTNGVLTPQQFANLARIPRAPRLIDGLTVEQCLAAYTCAQNEELPGQVEFLSDAQLDTASAMWSAELRAKVAASEAERRDRAPNVMIQIDAEDL